MINQCLYPKLHHANVEEHTDIIVRRQVKVTTGCSNAEGPTGLWHPKRSEGATLGARGVTTASTYVDSVSNLFRVSAHVA